jgi:hypothetical protein
LVSADLVSEYEQSLISSHIGASTLAEDGLCTLVGIAHPTRTQI